MGVRASTTVGELLAWAGKRLAHLPQPAREARRALRLATGGECPPREERLSAFTRGRFRRIVEARARGVPWPILEETTSFLDFEVLVPPGVFIPRPETEELAELAISLFAEAPPRPRALDIGTGTGILALALARARPDAEVWATDVSLRAVRAARRNAQRLGLKIHVCHSEGFCKLSGKFHLIVANPPYVAKDELPLLPKEVRGFDPRRALDGGKDGLECIRQILFEAPKFLEPEGVLILEVGPTQKEALLRMADSMGEWAETRVIPDLSGRPRFFLGRCLPSR
ncbi:MAG: peptide chain release factor N(5)-glutamine methyltransferase [Candidatus Bipolaricaulota bacterium]|nr:peptide chain release factor N(5)-glutamine methyltransferase [Candidatus Bipolaricaulota bacterium]MDW8126428.1 peptide chain release factor N(5)-glutamine methyltransferase [Candidatus Bipolaricaulota bacterium]